MSNYEYVGCFFNYEELFNKVKGIRLKPLEFEKTKPHVTFEYAPKTVNTTLFGEKISVIIDGYENNGENEGVRVTLSSQNKHINDMIKTIDRPHITLAVSKNGKAVNTKYLVFHNIKPIYIDGYYGGHIDK